MDIFFPSELCLLAVSHKCLSSFPSTRFGTGSPSSVVCFGVFAEEQLAVDARYLPADEWRERACSPHTMQRHPTVKKNTILSFLAKQVELEDIVLNKIGETKRQVSLPPISYPESTRADLNVKQR